MRSSKLFHKSADIVQKRLRLKQLGTLMRMLMPFGFKALEHDPLLRLSAQLVPCDKFFKSSVTIVDLIPHLREESEHPPAELAIGLTTNPILGLLTDLDSRVRNTKDDPGWSVVIALLECIYVIHVTTALGKIGKMRMCRWWPCPHASLDVILGWVEIDFIGRKIVGWWSAHHLFQLRRSSADGLVAWHHLLGKYHDLVSMIWFHRFVMSCFKGSATPTRSSSDELGVSEDGTGADALGGMSAALPSLATYAWSSSLDSTPSRLRSIRPKRAEVAAARSWRCARISSSDMTPSLFVSIRTKIASAAASEDDAGGVVGSTVLESSAD